MDGRDFMTFAVCGVAPELELLSVIVEVVESSSEKIWTQNLQSTTIGCSMSCLTDATAQYLEIHVEYFTDLNND